jgi:hypothetical protein
MQGRILAITGLPTLLLSSLLLTGCLNDPEESAEHPADATNPEISSDHELTGSVGDGPVVGAAMQVLTRDGALLMEFESGPSAGYEITVRTKGKHYPLHVHARHGVDLVTNIAPDFELTGIVPEPGKRSVANVNPYSTLVFKLAGGLPGGLNKENVQYAEDVVVRAFAGGLTSLEASGPLATPIGPDNVAEIVRASEELGEIVRRTRDTLNAVGESVDGDAVITMLASDLVDELIDGQGGTSADERASAINIFAAAGVMLESIAMQLRVYDADATTAMNLAIARVTGNSSSMTIDDLTVAEGQLAAARKALSIADALDIDPRAATLLAAVEDLRVGMGYQQARMIVPANYYTVMEELLIAVATGDETLVAEVNRLAAGNGVSPSENQPPTINGTPPTSTLVGGRYAFTPSASDPNGDRLTFSGTNIPSWASLDASSGLLSGIPDDADVGSYVGIEISVSDGEFSATLRPFSIQVIRGNSPPSLSGQPPQTALEGQPYTFTPAASDPDGDSLTFAAQRLPAWLNLDPATGRISGTPTAADVGRYDNIVLSVSDGLESSTLGPFAIDVIASGSTTGSVTLSWTPPTENTDGSALTNLSGYRLYWRSNAGTVTGSATISNPSVTTYLMENLASGTYLVVATAFNTAGVESENSNAIEIVVN